MIFLFKWFNAILATTTAGAAFLVVSFTTRPDQVWLLLIAVPAAVAITFYILRDIARSNEPTISLIIQMTSLGAMLIFLYAAAYRAAGIIDTGKGDAIGLADYIYFSIITWTTTGYGDFRPAPSARLIAASEALLGYVVMAIIIGITARPFVASRRPEKPE